MSKKKRTVYWIATAWLSLGMVSSAIVQLAGTKEEADFISNLGYPAYLMILIGVWKLLGVAVLLLPGKPLLKEWAYAGFFFLMTGAAFSHFAAGSVQNAAPSLLLLALTVISWYFRPAARRLNFNQTETAGL